MMRCRWRPLWILIVLALAAGAAAPARASGPPVPLQVAYAGSMTPLMERGIAPAVAKALNLELRGRGQGSTALANLIVAGNIHPDVFICITPPPMRTVLRAGKADSAVAIAHTDMVIAYSPQSRYAREFAAANQPGAKPWWRILESPGLRFGRTDPRTDPQGQNIIFTMELAGKFYKQPGLADRILGAQMNTSQIYQETEVMPRLQSGQLDAASAYETQPAAFGLSYVKLPREINLGDAALASSYDGVTVSLNGQIHHPEPLVFYAAVLKQAAHPALAARFIAWLKTPAAREILARYHYEDSGDSPGMSP